MTQDFFLPMYRFSETASLVCLADKLYQLAAKTHTQKKGKPNKMNTKDKTIERRKIKRKKTLPL